MRQLARFTVAMLDIRETDYVIDPTAGSGGFLLETLLQTWHGVDGRYAGQPTDLVERLKVDFALGHVYGIEIHDVLARICKINLLLHHDGHTNVEGGRSCLDNTFSLPRLNPPSAKFSRVVGNPPFGDAVKAGDDDLLGTNSLSAFGIAAGRSKVDSEQVILERCIDLLEPDGRLGLVLPDGVLNNQGWGSNCPQTRALLARSGRIDAVVSLPDFAFRKSGAQNKTSILFFRKYTAGERRVLDQALSRPDVAATPIGDRVDKATVAAGVDYPVFLAEANDVGYTTTGTPTNRNHLYRADAAARLDNDQDGTILGEYRRFVGDPANYQGSVSPDCMRIMFSDLWAAHASHRLDPKYHLFEREASRSQPLGWVKARLGKLMRRRYLEATPDASPDRKFKVMTISQTGEIRPREAGKGRNPPDWLGSYLAETQSKWFSARSGDVVFSGIDLWKGCIAVVPPEFDGALVTKEFPIYEVDDELDPEFLQCLLRSRHYQRAFRAITTGHSNRRRTQSADFEDLEIHFPPSKEEQRAAVLGILEAQRQQRDSTTQLRRAFLQFSDLIDGRGEEELPEIELSGSSEDLVE